jgi:hypothetical protein
MVHYATIIAAVCFRYFWICCELDLAIFHEQRPELTFT